MAPTSAMPVRSSIRPGPAAERHAEIDAGEHRGRRAGHAASAQAADGAVSGAHGLRRWSPGRGRGRDSRASAAARAARDDRARPPDRPRSSRSAGRPAATARARRSAGPAARTSPAPPSATAACSAAISRSPSSPPVRTKAATITAGSSGSTSAVAQRGAALAFGGAAQPDRLARRYGPRWRRAALTRATCRYSKLSSVRANARSTASGPVAGGQQIERGRPQPRIGHALHGDGPDLARGRTRSGRSPPSARRPRQSRAGRSRRSGRGSCRSSAFRGPAARGSCRAGAHRRSPRGCCARTRRRRPGRAGSRRPGW